MDEKFKEPDEASINRMTVLTITSLLETLQAQRAEKVKRIDQEIDYYKDLLVTKQAKRA